MALKLSHLECMMILLDEVGSHMLMRADLTALGGTAFAQHRHL